MSANDPSGSSQQRRDVCAPRSSPNASWVCGYAEIGKCCAAGPTAKGRCSLIASTSASATNQDGATAAEGELVPCIPRRSYRWRRQALCLNLAILTGGVLLLCMALPSREKTFVPGELSDKHAQILDNTLVSQRCGLCHPNSHVGDRLQERVEAIVGGGFLGGGGSKTGRSQAEPGSEQAASSATQDALCMKCHQGHMPGALERTPHDLSASVLRALSGQAGPSSWRTVGNRSTSADSSDPHHGELAKTNCSDCHVEHHGRGFDLKAMADDRCQACHRRKFESFTSGHPEFKNFPAERSRSFAFSHRLHADKHFPQKNRDFDCRKCHVDHGQPGNVGPITRSVRFETACAECHKEPIRAAAAGGWAVLQLPSIDAAAAGEDSQLAHWPAEARFGFEGSISPVLRALLEADDAASAALVHLPASGELADVPSIGDQREQVTSTLALAIERLVRDTARNGQAAWRDRLLKVTHARAGRELNAQELVLIDAMCAGLPPDLFRQMQAVWFDHGEKRPAERKSAATDSGQALGGNTDSPLPAKRQVPELSLVHKEPFRRDSSRMQGIVVERQNSGLLVSDQPAQNAATANQRGSSQPTDIQRASEADLLLDESPTTGGDLLAPGSSESDLLDSQLLGSDASDDELLSQAAPDKPAAETAAPIAGPSHLSGGGWYLDRETLALRYMPTGHADPTLAAWNMWWTLFRDAAGQPALPEVPRSASHGSITRSVEQQIPGGCVQCHRLGRWDERVRAGSLATAWQVPQRPLGVKEFTKFDHAPHLSLPAVNDCRYCHVLREASPSTSPSLGAPGTSGRLVSVTSDSHSVHHGSEFCEMQLAQCVACHRPSGANSGCLQCHNYHVTPPE